jgi:hypothetical protein
MVEETPKKGRGGARKGAGRPKGAGNIVSTTVKKLIMDTVEKLEAEDKSLHACAQQDPQWFYANFVKPMIPKEIEGTIDGELIVELVKYADSKDTE